MRTLQTCVLGLAASCLVLVVLVPHRLSSSTRGHMITANGNPISSLYDGLQSTEWGRRFKELSGVRTVGPGRCGSSAKQSRLNLEEHLGATFQRAQTCNMTCDQCSGSYQMEEPSANCGGNSSCPTQAPMYNETASCYQGYCIKNWECGGNCCESFNSCIWDNPDCDDHE
jgi:hypothetical protein